MKAGYVIAAIAALGAAGVGWYVWDRRRKVVDAAAEVITRTQVPSSLRVDQSTVNLSPEARRVEVTTKMGTFSLPAQFWQEATGMVNVRDARVL